MTDQLAHLHNNPPDQPRDQQPIVMNHLLRPALRIGGTLSMLVEPAQTYSADVDLQAELMRGEMGAQQAMCVRRSRSFERCP